MQALLAEAEDEGPDQQYFMTEGQGGGLTVRLGKRGFRRVNHWESMSRALH